MGFGAGAFGASPFGGGSPGPTTVEENGGHLVQVLVAGLADGTYRVHVGPLGSDSDPACLTGIPGTPNTFTAKDGRLSVFTPILPLGGPYRFTVVPTAGGSNTVTAPLLTVRRRWYRNAWYEMRRRWPTWLSVGFRRVAREPVDLPTSEDLLSATMSSVGQELDELAGHRITRLAGDLKAAYRVGTATDDATSADGTTVFRDGSTAWPLAVAVGMRFRVLSGPRAGESAVINTVLGLAIILDAGIAGAFTSATWEVVVDAETVAAVESAANWGASGRVVMGGVLYRYASRTDLELRELTHWDGTAWITGAAGNLVTGAEVHDSTGDYSEMDRLRRGTRVGDAEGEDLNIIGRNLQVLRPDRTIDEESYRALIRAIAYRSKGHRNVLRAALNAVLGVGGWELFEDLATHVRSVFVRRIGAELSDVGKWFLPSVERRRLTGAAALTLLKSPSGVVSATLAPEGGVRLIAEGSSASSADGLTITGPASSFPARIQVGDQFEVLDGPRTGAMGVVLSRTSDVQIVLESPTGVGGRIDGAAWRITRRCSVFEWIRPSTEVVLEYDGDTGTTMWAFVGADETTVAQVNGEGIQFTAPAGPGTSYYRRYLRILSESRLAFEITFMPISGFDPTATAGSQFGIRVRDTARVIAVGCIEDGGDVEIGFVVASTGAFVAGAAITVAYDDVVHVRVEKEGSGTVRLYVNGALVQEAAYSAFSTNAVSVGSIEFGCLDNTYSGLQARVRQVDYFAETHQDYLLLPIGTCSITAPNRVLNGTNPFVAGDVGKSVRITAAPTANGRGGTAVGEWIGEVLLAAGDLQVAGVTRADGRVTDVDTSRFDANDPAAFHYPDSLGMQVEILDGPNAGTRTIDRLIDQTSGVDLATFDPATVGVGGGDRESLSMPNNGLTGACLFAEAVVQEDSQRRTWRMVPDFPSSSGTNVSIELVGRGALAGAALTLARSVGIYDVSLLPAVMEVRYWLHRSGFHLDEEDFGDSPPAAYLVDTFGWLGTVLYDLMAHGYKIALDRFYRDASGPHVIDP